MKKIISYIILTASLGILIHSCNKPRDTVSGEIAGLADGSVYLRVWEGVMRTLDSTRSENGRFILTVPEILPDMLFIQFEAFPDYYLPVITGEGDVIITGNFNYSDDLTVTGTPSNDQLNEHRRQVRMQEVMIDALDKHIVSYNDSIPIIDTLSYLSIIAKRDSIDSVIARIEENYIRENPSSILSAFLILSAARNEESLARVDSLSALLSTDMPENAFIHRLERRREELLERQSDKTADDEP